MVARYLNVGSPEPVAAMDLHGCARKPVPRATPVRPEMTLARDAKLLISRYFPPESAWENRQPRLHKRSFQRTPASPAVAFASWAQYEHGYCSGPMDRGTSRSSRVDSVRTAES